MPFARPTLRDRPVPVPMRELTPHVSAKQRVFQSIFKPSPSESTPTPLATPISATQTSVQASFSSSTASNASTQPDYEGEDDFVRSTRAWHIATAFLTFSTRSFPRKKLNEAAVNAFLARKHQEASTGGVIQAIRWLNRPESQKKNQIERETQNLLDWYQWQTRRHFLSWSERYVVRAKAPLEETLNRLLTVHAIYTELLQHYVLVGFPASELEGKAAQYTQELNSLISYQLEKGNWANNVYEVFLHFCGIVLGIEDGDDDKPDVEDSMRVDDEDDDQETEKPAFPSIDETVEQAIDINDSQQTIPTQPDDDGDIHLSRPSTAPASIASDADDKPYMRALYPDRLQLKARKKLLRIWATLQLLGLGGSGRRGERVFAEAVHTLITKYVDKCYSGIWQHPSSAQEEIGIWVAEGVSKLVKDVLSTNIRRDVVDGRTVPARRILSPRASFRASTGRLSLGAMMDEGGEEEDDVVKPEDVETWKKIASTRLGRLRVSELFDIVVEWPDSKGGIQDLCDYISTPTTRLHLITTFNQTITNRLLHPGASTADILKVYISLIEAFAMLDPKGVLLDRVSRGIRRYLKDRDDTLRIIVRGVFGPGAEGENREEYSIDLTQSLATQAAPTAQTYDDFDYDDMSWVPDPVDAGSDFKRSKGSDVVGSLLDLYENKESVVKEIQTYLASRLLEKEDDADMDHEIRTLELLKNRLSGDAALQSCDVMIKDLSDSRRTDDLIHQQLYNTEMPLELHAKILSKMYWPRLKEDTFNVPGPVAEVQAAYAAEFEKINDKRKLVWLPVEGYVDVELEMENRILRIEGVKPAFATVIYAFSSEDDEDVRKTVEQLEDVLEMDTSLVKKALAYWCNKGILHEVEKDTYTILDSSSGEGAEGGAADSSGGAQAIDDEEDAPKLTPAERVMYSQFTFGMLMNSKRAMTTAEIMRTLEMLVPGGCNCSELEMEGLMEEMEERGIRREGEVWRYKK